MLSTVDDVIDALGGPTEAADRLGQKANVIGNWKIRGKIPAEQFLAVSEALRAVNKAVSPSVFGMAEVRGRRVRRDSRQAGART